MNPQYFNSQDDFALVSKIAGKANPVYVAHSFLDNKLFAIKLYPYKDQKPSVFYLFESRFDWFKHSNIISIEECQTQHTFSSGMKGKYSYIMMELAPYGNLGDLIREEKLPNDIRLMRTFFKQIVSGLDYLHKNGISHMDLKPQNLLLGKDYTIKLADFDCAQVEEDSMATSQGTENFRAPEVIAADCWNTKAADVYSLGIILFSLVAKMLPYDEKHTIEGKNLFSLCKEQSPIFWECHKQLDVCDDFKELFFSMVRVKPSERATLEDIRESRWYSGPVYSSIEVRNMLKNGKKVNSLVQL